MRHTKFIDSSSSCVRTRRINGKRITGMEWNGKNHEFLNLLFWWNAAIRIAGIAINCTMKCLVRYKDYLILRSMGVILQPGLNKHA